MILPPSPAAGNRRLYLVLDETAYAVSHLDPHPDVARRAFALQKADGTVYHVHDTPHGCECSCPDWTYRRCKAGEPCKHITALRAYGMLPNALQQRQACACRVRIPFDGSRAALAKGGAL